MNGGLSCAERLGGGIRRTLDISILVAILAVIVTAAAVFIDALQTRSIRKINLKVEAFEQQDIGASFGEWLLTKEKEDSPTNLEAMASLVGKQIAGSFSMGLKGIASDESRTIRAVEQKLMEGLQTPESKALIELADRLGIDRSLAGTLLDVLQKRGLNPEQLLNRNNGGGSASSW